MVTAKLIFIDFQFHTEIDSNDEEWINPKTGKIFKINKSYDFYSEDNLSSVLDQAGVSIEEFLEI